MTSAKCPLCDSPRVCQLALMRGLAVAKCLHCGIVFVTPQTTPKTGARAASGAYYEHLDLAGYVDYYGSFRQRIFEASFARLEQHLRASRELPHKETIPLSILDIGCSFGWFLDVARRHGCRAIGLEPSREVAAYARERYGLDVREGGIGQVGTLNEEFDAVTMWNVLEHVSDPCEALAAIRAKLRRGGILALSVPNVAGLFSRLSFLAYRLTGGKLSRPLETLYQIEHEPMHLFHFSEETLTALLERTGFTVLEIVQQDIIDPRNIGKRAKLENAGWFQFKLLQLPVLLVFHLSCWLRMRDEMALYARRT